MGRLALASGSLAGLFAGCTCVASELPRRARGGVGSPRTPARARLPRRRAISSSTASSRRRSRAYKRALAKDPDAPELLRKVAELSARDEPPRGRGRPRRARLRARPRATAARGSSSARSTASCTSRRASSRCCASPTASRSTPTPRSSSTARSSRRSASPRRCRSRGGWSSTSPTALRGWFALADAHEKLGDCRRRRDGRSARGLTAHPGELALYGALARAPPRPRRPRRRDRDLPRDAERRARPPGDAARARRGADPAERWREAIPRPRGGPARAPRRPAHAPAARLPRVREPRLRGARGAASSGRSR